MRASSICAFASCSCIFSGSGVASSAPIAKRSRCTDTSTSSTRGNALADRATPIAALSSSTSPYASTRASSLRNAAAAEQAGGRPRRRSSYRSWAPCRKFRRHGARDQRRHDSGRAVRQGCSLPFIAECEALGRRSWTRFRPAGGQLTALYPEKYIFDVAGFPKSSPRISSGASKSRRRSSRPRSTRISTSSALEQTDDGFRARHRHRSLSDPFARDRRGYRRVFAAPAAAGGAEPWYGRGSTTG